LDLPDQTGKVSLARDADRKNVKEFEDFFRTGVLHGKKMGGFHTKIIPPWAELPNIVLMDKSIQRKLIRKFTAPLLNEELLFL